MPRATPSPANRKAKETTPKSRPSSGKPKPSWDDTLHDLSKLKPTSDELARRKEALTSKHLLLGDKARLRYPEHSARGTPSPSPHKESQSAAAESLGASQLEGLDVGSVLAGFVGNARPSPDRAAASPSDDRQPEELEFLSDGLVDFEAEVRQFEQRARAVAWGAASASPSDRAAAPPDALEATLSPAGALRFEHRAEPAHGSGLVGAGAQRLSREGGAAAASPVDGPSSAQRDRGQGAEPVAPSPPSSSPDGAARRRAASAQGASLRHSPARENDAARGNQSGPFAASRRPSTASAPKKASAAKVRAPGAEQSPGKSPARPVTAPGAASKHGDVVTTPAGGVRVDGGSGGDLLARVEALEKQVFAMATLPALVRELQRSVDALAGRQSDLQSEVTQHCSHASSLLTAMQAQMSGLMTAGPSSSTVTHSRPHLETGPELTTGAHDAAAAAAAAAESSNPFGSTRHDVAAGGTPPRLESSTVGSAVRSPDRAAAGMASSPSVGDDEAGVEAGALRELRPHEVHDPEAVGNASIATHAPRALQWPPRGLQAPAQRTWLTKALDSAPPPQLSATSPPQRRPPPDPPVAAALPGRYGGFATMATEGPPRPLGGAAFPANDADGRERDYHLSEWPAGLASRTSPRRRSGLSPRGDSARLDAVHVADKASASGVRTVAALAFDDEGLPSYGSFAAFRRSQQSRTAT